MRLRSYNLTLLRVVVLSLLKSRGCSYGEALRLEVNEILPDHSTWTKVYVVLVRLESAGLIKVLGIRPHPLGGQLPPVKYYQLTREGDKFLNKTAEDLDKIHFLLHAIPKS